MAVYVYQKLSGVRKFWVMGTDNPKTLITPKLEYYPDILVSEYPGLWVLGYITHIKTRALTIIEMYQRQDTTHYV